MTKQTRGRGVEPLSEQLYSTARRSTRLGSHTYLPAPHNAGTSKGTLAKGGLLVTLEVTEEILQEFMDTMNSLERQISERWASSEMWFHGSPAE
ncbi:hypothetical protein JK359_06480 [Streptomyces actinomycinicus]|uniref:Uncharacterized protein n=1 Tax=Streptomyces actinomycinicus TaxID=1695166 RepID=A0A937JMS4_9ACTN|nr:hypothetical protein [Streptomyces actinomycinicus]MBL1081627.1 hypothetical protein [Streptomyces actinomycinicus]